MGRKITAAAVALAAGALLVASAAPAGACGGLVGENGTIELVRTTTLAAYSDGVERYVTAFEFTGEGEEVGSIVPLPDVPTEVDRGPATGRCSAWPRRWRRRRGPARRRRRSPPTGPARRRGHPRDRDRRPRHHRAQRRRRRGRRVGASRTASSSPPTRPRCSTSTPSAARCSWPPASTPSGPHELGPGRGRQHADHGHHPDRRPVGAACASSASASTATAVEADVFLLTDDEPELLAGGTGLTLERSEPANDLLLDDLRSDVGMEWVPERHVALVPDARRPGRRARLRPGRLRPPRASRPRWSTPAWPSPRPSPCCRDRPRPWRCGPWPPALRPAPRPGRAGAVAAGTGGRRGRRAAARDRPRPSAGRLRAPVRPPSPPATGPARRRPAAAPSAGCWRRLARPWPWSSPAPATGWPRPGGRARAAPPWGPAT